MGTVHRLIEQQGKQGALDVLMAQGRKSGGRDPSLLSRAQIEAAAGYMCDEETGIGYCYSGWCQAALPHRRLPDGEGWVLESGPTTLIVQPGMRRNPGSDGRTAHYAVPYGSRARLIMIFLQSEAIRTQSREIEMGHSLRGWMKRLGIPIGGKSIDAVREQSELLSRCRLTFEIRRDGAVGLESQNIVDRALFMEDPESESSGALFQQTAKLGEGFFEELLKHPVPLEEPAIRALSNNSGALDIYAWLAYRLHSLKAPCPVNWRAIQAQFGKGFGRLDNFRHRFAENLKLALAVYPEARVDMDERGLVLHPSRPPVSPRPYPVRRNAATDGRSYKSPRLIAGA